MTNGVCSNQPATLTAHDLFFGFIRSHPQLVAIYLLLLIVMPIQNIGIPHLIGKLVDNIQRPLWPLVWIIAIFILVQAGDMASDTLEAKLLPDFQEYIRERVLRQVFQMQTLHHQELKTAEILQKLIKLPAAFYEMLEDLKNWILPQLLVVLMIAIYFAFIDIYLAAAVLAFFILFVSLTLYTLRKCSATSQNRDHTYNHIYESVDDILRNSLAVLNANAYEKEIDRLQVPQQAYRHLSEDSVHCALWSSKILIPLALMLFLGTLIYMQYRVARKQVPLGMFVSVVFILLEVMYMLWESLGHLKSLVFRWGMVQESMEIFGGLPKISKSPSHIAATPSAPGIILQNVSFAYPGAHPLLTNINLTFPQGRTTLLLGGIGTGKSTILKLCMKYLQPTSGEIYYKGIPYASLSPEHLRRLFAYIPQTPTLFDRTVYENITYGIPMTPQRSALLDDLLTQVNLPSLTTNAGKMGSHLSGGQRQMVWILRAILQDPEVILMDEPTNALDDASKAVVLRLLRRLMHKKTVIMVTHDTNLTKEADIVLRMEGPKP